MKSVLKCCRESQPCSVAAWREVVFDSIYSSWTCFFFGENFHSAFEALRDPANVLEFVRIGFEIFQALDQQCFQALSVESRRLGPTLLVALLIKKSETLK